MNWIFRISTSSIFSWALYTELEDLVRCFVAAVMFYLVAWLVLSAVRHRWAPYAPHARRFVLTCAVGLLIAGPTSLLLEDSLWVMGGGYETSDVLLGLLAHISFWAFPFGAAIGGVVFLQRHGLTDLRIFRSVIWLTVAISFALSSAELLYTQVLLVQLQVYWSTAPISIVGGAYLIFLVVVSRLFRCSIPKVSSPRYASVLRVFGYYLAVFSSLIIFMMLFLDLNDFTNGGSFAFSDTIAFSPGKVLLVSALCAFLVTRLQHFLPAMSAHDSEKFSTENVRENHEQMRNKSPERLSEFSNQNDSEENRPESSEQSKFQASSNDDHTQTAEKIEEFYTQGKSDLPDNLRGMLPLSRWKSILIQTVGAIFVLMSVLLFSYSFISLS